MNIEQALKSFFTHITYDGHSPHTIRAYRQDLYQWYECMHKKQLDDLTYDDFDHYLATLYNQELKASSLRRKRVVIHRFLKYCYDKRFCTQHLYTYIDPIKLKKHKKPKEVLTTREIQSLFRFIEDEKQVNYEKMNQSNHYAYLYYTWFRNHLLTSILLYTGCRATEVVSLKKKDINKQQGTLTILAKGHKYNIIPLHEKLLQGLMCYDKSLQLLTNEEIKNHIINSDYLFPSRTDVTKPMSTRTLHDLMHKYGQHLDRHIHAHIFRHTFASYCIAANMDISTISSLISHSNPAITLSIYTHEIESNQKHREMKKLTFEDFDT